MGRVGASMKSHFLWCTAPTCRNLISRRQRHTCKRTLLYARKTNDRKFYSYAAVYGQIMRWGISTFFFFFYLCIKQLLLSRAWDGTQRYLETHTQATLYTCCWCFLLIVLCACVHSSIVDWVCGGYLTIWNGPVCLMPGSVLCRRGNATANVNVATGSRDTIAYTLTHARTCIYTQHCHTYIHAWMNQDDMGYLSWKDLLNHRCTCVHVYVLYLYVQKVCVSMCVCVWIIFLCIPKA